MPDSDRSKRLPGWVKAVGYGGLCLAAAALLSGLFYQVHYAQQAEYSAAEYASNAARESYQSCRVSPLSKLDECLADAEREYRQKRNDNRREYADLVAQQRSALWTAIMGVAALIGMALSAIGVWLVYTTFRETQRSAQIAQDNLAAFQHAERGFVHIIDAHLAEVDVLSGMFPGGPLRRFYFHIENPGRTGVRITRIRTTHRPDAHWDWNWDDPAIRVFGSIVPAFCKEGVSGALAGDFEFDFMTEQNVVFGMIEYETLGLAGCKSHFVFAINYDNRAKPAFVRMEALQETPADT